MIDVANYLSDEGCASAVRPSVPAPEPGIYPGTPMADYLRWDALSASTLRHVLEDGAEFAAWQRGFTSEETASTNLGTAIHARAIEPDTFDERFQIREIRGKGVKERMANLEEAGVTLITRSAMDISSVAAAQLQANDKAAKLLDAPMEDREVAIVFDTKHKGVSLRGKIRLDLLRRDGKIACDLKSTRSIRYRDLSAQCGSLAYEMGHAWYERGLFASEIEVDHYFYLYVENSLPCRVKLHELGEASSQLGRAEIEFALTDWCTYLKDGAPKADESVRPLECPEWKFTAWSNRLESGGSGR